MSKERIFAGKPSPRSRSSRWIWTFVLPALIGLAALYGSSKWFFQEQRSEAGEHPSDAASTEEPALREPAANHVARAREEGRVRAPELDGGVAWLNTAGPLRLRDLRGKIVLLDFWTLCCINCIHTLPDLAKLEKKYPNQLVVIGVHSAKFDNEKNSESIRKAILRYEISHPVVNDANLKIWQAYAVNSWPTLYLVDPEGYLVGRGSGEGLGTAVDSVIAKLIKEHRAKKTLNEAPIRFDLARFRERGDSPLFFPGKVLADGVGGRLFIADSTHHRIVITDLAGRKIAVAGTGQPGKADGPFDRASFNDPQGLALRGDTLYVADRKNHLIRALDLKNKTVKTIAGNGEKGEDRRRGGEALQVGLNSPWDLCLHGNTLYIAMAGHHQIWTLNLEKGLVAPYAGSGRENISDGPLTEACFAQPSGLTSNATTLYVADSEVSAIRAVPLDGKGDVKTIVGEGLFEFGDIDGVGNQVRLQHALGVAYHDGKLYVADTYNSKMKVIDPLKRSCTTFLDGKADGWLAGSIFSEPGGLSIAGDKMYVADTNNHRILVVNLKTKAISTLELHGIEAPKLAQNADWLSSSLALAAGRSDPFAAENKTAEKAGRTTQKDADDPFAPARQVKDRPATAVQGAQESAKATPKGKPTPIDERIDFEITVTPKQVRRGETVQLTVTGTPRPGFHTYPLTQRSADPAQDPSQLSTLTYGTVPGLQPLWPVVESDPQPKLEEGVGWFLEHELPFTWKQDILILPDATPGEKTLPLTIKAQVCNASNCVVGEPQFEVKLDVSPADPVPLTPALQERLKARPPQTKVVPVPGAPLASKPAPAAARQSEPSAAAATIPAKNEDRDLLAFVLQGVWFGAISLLTPCVFPMIPITVSFFLKQSERAEHRALTMAAVYSSTIVIVLTVSGLLLIPILQPLSQHWVTNLVLGALFVFFALSLFGMYDIQLPAGLANFTSSQERRGGLIGTMFMALTFTIISFTCVAPFYGGFIALAASAQSVANWLKLFLGALAFSATFAAPFFVLALFPTLLRSLPKSGSWMNAMKVVMGFLELAAALKFLRAAELLRLGQAEFFTYDFVLGIYVALAILCGLYLLNLYRLPHDHDVPEHLGVGRLIFSLLFLSLGLYLAPGLLKQESGEPQRPRGAVFNWVDAFLLRDKPGGTAALPQSDRDGEATTAVRSQRPVWLGNFAKGLRQAEEQKRLLFLNFTGLG